MLEFGGKGKNIEFGPDKCIKGRGLLLASHIHLAWILEVNSLAIIIMPSSNSLNSLLIVVIVVGLLAVQQVKGAVRYNNGAVATDVANCSKMGNEILKKNGSAVDSAITSLLCIGVANGQSSGIGGGFLMVISNRSNEHVDVLNAVETAPAAADPANFDGTETDNNRAKEGFQAAGIPAEIRGMWEAHQRYGNLPWADLFEPVIAMARNGFKVGWHLRRALRMKSFKNHYPDLEKFYYKEGRTRTAYENETIKMPVLADTLQRIAENGPDEFYNSTGQTAINFIHDVEEGGGDITFADLEGYRPEWTSVETLTSFSSSNYTVYSPPLTSSGVFMQFMLRVMDGFDLPTDVASLSSMTKEDEVELYHRWIEVCKFGFGARTRLGDTKSALLNKTLANLRSEDFTEHILDLIHDEVTYTWGKKYANEFDRDVDVEEDEDMDDEDLGDTSHVSILAPNGDAVSVTTSVGHYFGAKVISTSTGIILNNRMNNFNYDWKFKTWTLPENTLAPGKRPLTTMGPSIILKNNGDVKMVVGSSGGIRIPSANAWVIIRTLLMNADLKDAIEERRIQNSLLTNKAFYEKDFPADVVEALETRGQKTEYKSSFATVQGIVQYDDGIAAHSDTRKRGVAVGY